MLDSTFPFAISLLRLRASLVATHSSKQRVSSVIERILAGDFSDPPTPREHFVSQLPDVVSGNFTFLVYDAPGYINFHRGKPERQWTAQLAGNGAVDVQELASVCPSGCLVRTAWAGAGHVGLCPVDRFNAMGGASSSGRSSASAIASITCGRYRPIRRRPPSQAPPTLRCPRCLLSRPSVA